MFFIVNEEIFYEVFGPLALPERKKKQSNWALCYYHVTYAFESEPTSLASLAKYSFTN